MDGDLSRVRRVAVYEPAVGESSAILLHSPLPLAGLPTGKRSGCQHNDRNSRRRLGGARLAGLLRRLPRAAPGGAGIGRDRADRACLHLWGKGGLCELGRDQEQQRVGGGGGGGGGGHSRQTVTRGSGSGMQQGAALLLTFRTIVSLSNSDPLSHQRCDDETAERPKDRMGDGLPA